MASWHEQWPDYRSELALARQERADYTESCRGVDGSGYRSDLFLARLARYDRSILILERLIAKERGRVV